MRSVFVFVTLMVACSALKSASQNSISMESTVSKLQAMENNQWKQVALDFLELSIAVESPTGDLMIAFQDFYQDLGFKQDIEVFDFNVKEAEHDEWEAAIRARIAHAEKDIADSTHRLENVLYPNKAQYEKWIAEDYALIAKTEGEMEVATVNRDAERVANAAYVEEARVAVDALAECLAILSDFPSGEASFIQVTKTKKSFKKLQKSLKNTKFGPTITALIKLADFANPEMLAKLVGKFTEVRNSLSASIEQSLAEEAQQQADFDAFMANCSETIVNANARIVENKALLAQCITDIANTEAFRAQRQLDLAVAQEELADELARWAKEVEIFKKLMGEMDAEFAAVSDIIDVFVEMGENMKHTSYETINAF